MANNTDNKNEGLIGSRSVLNVDAQKELIDFTIKKNMKMMLIAFPVVMVFMLGVMYVVFTFVMNMTRR
jgi:hypothetical protein